MAEFKSTFHVHFGDVDKENRLTFRGMMRHLQESANQHSDRVGYGVNQIAQTNYSWVLYQLRIHMFARPCWNTALHITTWSRGADGLVCLRDFEVADDEGHRVAIASSGWLLVDAMSQRMIKIPEGMMEEYGTVEKAVFAEPFERLKPAPDAVKCWEYPVSRKDIDINRHVNNLNYIDFALEAMPPEADETMYNDIRIMFRKAAFPGDTIAVSADWNANGPMTAAIKNADGSILHAVVRLDSLEL